jgi:hypothetical protein
MTEAEWLVCADSNVLLEFLRTRENKRKLRLFAVACCGRAWPLFIDERSRNAIRVAELFADGRVTGEDLRVARDCAIEARRAVVRPRRSDFYYWGDASAEAAVACAAAESFPPADRPAPQHDYFTTAAGGVANAKAAQRLWLAEEANPLDLIEGDASPSLWDEIRGIEWAAQAVLLRDVFGNPFRPVAFSPAWRTDTAVSLARTMYEARHFSAMPILADALQDAGCDNPDVLDHCRDDAQVHVRGCWVVDLVLGKV